MDTFFKTMNLDFDEKILITNAKYFEQFKNWATDKGVEVYSDGIESKENRLGAVGDLLFIIDKLQIDDDILVCAPDHICDFDFNEFLGDTSASGVAIEKDESKFKAGSCLTMEDDLITRFEEKPEKAFSNLYGLPYYFIKKKDINFMRNVPAAERDNSGQIVKCLVEHTAVRGIMFHGKSVHITSKADL
jgi:glucose-1-phosphate thymidylyltransferase